MDRLEHAELPEGLKVSILLLQNKWFTVLVVGSINRVYIAVFHKRYLKLGTYT